MDLQRTILFVALTFVLLLIWQAWQHDYGTPNPLFTMSAPVADASKQAATGTPTQQDIPSAPTPAAANGTPDATPAVPASAELKSAQRIHVKTDVIDATIDTVGGDLRQVLLPKYPVSVTKPNQPTHLLDDRGAHLFIAQSGLRGDGSSREAPDHHAIFTADKLQYALGTGQDTLQVRLHWRSSDGVEVDKVYTFHRGSYVVDVAYVVKNDSARAWTGHMYNQLQSTEPAKKKHAFTHTYNGGAIYSPEKKYEKVSYEDMKEKSLSEQITGGWAAVLEHYFFGAWIPSAKEAAHYYTKALNNGRYLIGMIGPGFSVAPGASGKAEARLYVGPKEQTTLADIAPGLELTVDYGRLTFLAKPIFAAMEFIHKIVGNWGWSIILLTMLIKLAFYKLSATSYRSMANMRKMQPRMKALKERFGDDKQKLNEAMMKMYKEEKINPLGGCLPIVVQIPVFIALYWVLLESVELRQAPFILWIHDLSTADPYYVLPLIMGVTMLIQQRLNPSPLDPIQQKVMMILPVVFTIFFAFFPAGLVLYWVVNNTLSITQQWYITRSLDKA